MLVRFITLTALTTLLSSATFAYNAPTSSTDPLRDPRAHGIVALKALTVLQGDGKDDAKAFHDTHLQQLLKGTREADTGGGEFSLAGHRIPKNSFTHFYNPSTGKGFVLDFGKYNWLKNFVSYLSLAPWEYFTLKGPHPSMADMADWYYAKAVQAMRAGNKGQALEYLGYVLHYVADATVPQHVADEGAQKPGSKHQEYEDFCDTQVVLGDFPHAALGGEYRPDATIPSDYVKGAAVLTRPLLSKAMNPSQYVLACRDLIPVAEKCCAGILDRFFRLWQSEQFRVAVVTIDRVRAKTYYIPGRSLDCPDQADLYAHVTIDGRRYDTGAVDGRDDMRPNALIPHAWVFPKWISGGRSSVPIRIAIWDDDGVTADDQAYISPKKNKKELEINYNLHTGNVTGDTSADASGGRTSVHTKGNHSSGDEAQIWFHIDRLP